MAVYASSANQAEAEKSHQEIVHFAFLDFADGPLRASTWTGTLSWGGYDWLGLGYLGDVSEITEDAMLRPSGITLTMSGVDAANVSSAMGEAAGYHGRTVIVYEGFMDSDGVLVDDPEIVFKGIMDVMSYAVGAGTAEITVRCEGELARWDRHRGLLYTQESQQQIYPGDNFFDRVPLIQNKTISWVKKSLFGTIGAAFRGYRQMTGK